MENVLNIAAQDFLTYELKFSKNEIEDLDITNITRPRSENSDTIYIHCKTEKAVQYIHRKKAKVDNTEIKTKPFIPPQLYGRFVDISKNTFEARKENEQLKTQIRLGEDDLILLVKHKGDRDWEVEPNMSILGPIREPEWHKLWPAPICS